WLLAQLLAYHRREAKVGWWRWYRQVEMTSEELEDDAEALGPLTFDGVVGHDKSSEIVRYRFTPQEHRIRTGSDAFTPCVREGRRDAMSAGSVEKLDDVAGTIDLKRGATVGARSHPDFLIPGKPFDTRQ